MSTQKTANYQLNQWVSSDRIQMEDFNTDNQKVDTALKILADQTAQIANYDVVFLGFPIWWYVAPTIINSFLESYDFAGKTIVLFATSGGSPMGRTLEILRPLCNASVKWLPAKMLNGATDSDLNAWLKSLKLD